MENQKMKYGQFYTKTNPFTCDPFYKWISLVGVDDFSKLDIIEPFAGANNIVDLVTESLLISEVIKDPNSLQWYCYDIDPASEEENVTNIPIEQRDTIKNMPEETNPGNIYIYIYNKSALFGEEFCNKKSIGY